MSEAPQPGADLDAVFGFGGAASSAEVAPLNSSDASGADSTAPREPSMHRAESYFPTTEELEVSDPEGPGGILGGREGKKTGARARAKSYKLQEPDASPAAEATASAAAECMFAAVQIRPPSSAPKGPPPNEGVLNPAKLAAVGLPDPLPVPKADRCSFDIKFDSVCSQCHFKWQREGLKQRHARFHASLKAAPTVVHLQYFFMAVAHGTPATVEALLEQAPQLLTSYGPFASCVATVGASSLLSTSGAVSALHIAFAFDRPEIAAVLFAKGALLRRSERKVYPQQFLAVPLSAGWQELLDGVPQYADLQRTDKAKALRQCGLFAEAEAEYDRVLARCPRNENALCGLAKMAFDQRRFGDCIRRCDAVLQERDAVEWVEFGPVTVESLRRHALEEWHAVSHAAVGPALRECGCVVTAAVRLRLRRLPFAILRDHVVPFLDVAAAFALHEATRLPLLRSCLVAHAPYQGEAQHLAFLQSEPETYEALLRAVAADAPEHPTDPRLGGPLAMHSVTVTAMADFNALLITALLHGPAPKRKEPLFSFGKKKRIAPESVAFVKQFQLSRQGPGQPWDAHAAGEWELVDVPRSESLPLSPDPA